MREPDLYDAATALAGENTVKFTRGNNIEFFSEVENPPTQSAIDTKLAELISDWEAQAYSRNRNYPDIGEQLDMLYWDKKNDTKNWEDAIDKVKADNPKPE